MCISFAEKVARNVLLGQSQHKRTSKSTAKRRIYRAQSQRDESLAIVSCTHWRDILGCGPFFDSRGDLLRVIAFLI